MNRNSRVHSHPSKHLKIVKCRLINSNFILIVFAKNQYLNFKFVQRWMGVFIRPFHQNECMNVGGVRDIGIT